MERKACGFLFCFSLRFSFQFGKLWCHLNVVLYNETCMSIFVLFGFGFIFNVRAMAILGMAMAWLGWFSGFVA